MLSSEQVDTYHRDGYLLVEKMFDDEEAGLLRRASREDPAMAKRAVLRDDGEGGQSKITLWNMAGDDLFSLFSRSERMVDAMDQLLGGESYHWHSKMMQKEARGGGAWVWHQDYGYWYNDACLFPYLASCFVAVDPSTRENGCLQVLKGSHHLGRIDHMKVGQQVGADPDRVKEAEKLLELVYVTMNPGDGLFFHCNLLHRSDQNTSDMPRWALISCFNRRDNSPYRKVSHPEYSPVERVPDGAIKEAGLRFIAEENEFLPD